MRTIAIALLAACAALSCRSTGGSDEAARNAESSSGIMVGRAAIDFTARDVDGKSVSLSSYLGKRVVLLDFYTTWCEPCVAELPHLKRLYEQEKENGFVIIAVAMDGPETIANVRAFVQRNNLKFPMLIDEDSRIAKAYNPAKTAPFMVLIDKQANVVVTRAGYSPGDETALAKEVLGLLPHVSSVN